MYLLDVNRDLSNYIYSTHKAMIFMKECYANVARLCTNLEFKKEFRDNDVKIVFGGSESACANRKLFIKHAFFLIDGEVVDPTLALGDRLAESYMAIKVFEIEEYLQLLYENDLDTSLGKYGMELFHEATMKLLKEDVFLIG